LRLDKRSVWGPTRSKLRVKKKKGKRGGDSKEEKKKVPQNQGEGEGDTLGSLVTNTVRNPAPEGPRGYKHGGVGTSQLYKYGGEERRRQGPSARQDEGVREERDLRTAQNVLSGPIAPSSLRQKRGAPPVKRVKGSA